LKGVILMAKIAKKGMLFLLAACFLLMLKVLANPDSLISQADSLFAQNYKEEALRESLRLYEEALREDPENSYLLNRLSEGYYILGFAHLFVFAQNPEETEKERLNSYNRGFKFGWQSLELNSAFAVLWKRDFREAISLVEDISALHWTSNNWGRILEAEGVSFRAWQELPKLKATFERAVVLKENYLYGGPLRSLGAFYASLPWWWGQDLEKARFYFERAIDLFPDFLANLAIFAKEYALRKKDCELLREIVERFKNSPALEEPQFLPEHLVWHKVAIIGLEKLIEENKEWCPIDF
jgi:tetratricopeptide (TPR) repeat protein